ncbi:hypothetical protein [Microbacterium terrisoli]|uniref:hypothetical protein n=1 Tax=Microbacterium terrisoli TaxID=3242192 RepID=UPI002804A186|nr:hypothetical protein [Microbacterium protaetiae]
MTSEAWTPDKLPEPRQSGATFGDMLASIILMGALAGAVLWDLWLGFVPGHRVSLVNPALWPIAIMILFVIMAVAAMLAVIDAFAKARRSRA